MKKILQIFSIVFLFSIFFFNFDIDIVKSADDCCIFKTNETVRACLEDKVIGSTNFLLQTSCKISYDSSIRSLNDPESIKNYLDLLKLFTNQDFSSFNITKVELIDCNAYPSCQVAAGIENPEYFKGIVSKKEFNLSNVENFSVTFNKVINSSVLGMNNLYKLKKIECSNCNTIPGLSYVAPSTSFVNNSNSGVDSLSLNFKFEPFVYIKELGDRKLDQPFNLEFKATGEWTSGSETGQVIQNFATFPLVIKGANCTDYKDNRACSVNSGCIWISSVGKCEYISNNQICNVLNKTECAVASAVCALDKNERCVSTVSKTVDETISSEHPRPENYTGPLPDCAFDGSCRDFNSLVKLALNSVDYLFSFVGALAFVMFIYGGFTWIFSFGNSDKVQKGQQIIVYAVIGLVIVFSAYLLVDFLLDAIGLRDSFRAIN